MGGDSGDYSERRGGLIQVGGGAGDVGGVRAVLVA